MGFRVGLGLYEEKDHKRKLGSGWKRREKEKKVLEERKRRVWERILRKEEKGLA